MILALGDTIGERKEEENKNREQGSEIPAHGEQGT
jgi:hypothetical protein